MPLIINKDSKTSGMSLFSVIKGFELKKKKIPQLTLPEIIEKNKRELIRKKQEAKLKKTLRFYKGKYPCEVLHRGKKKALVMWLCYCDVVGSKKLGYKTVHIFDKDIINSMRLLEKEVRD